MIWYMVLCSFVASGGPQCDRGLSFEKYEDCQYHVELVLPVKGITDAYCEWESDDVSY